jgi:hypothetical protein
MDRAQARAAREAAAHAAIGVKYSWWYGFPAVRFLVRLAAGLAALLVGGWAARGVGVSLFAAFHSFVLWGLAALVVLGVLLFVGWLTGRL